MSSEPTISQLTKEIVEWADVVFPGRSPARAFLKMFSELGELIDNPSSGSEYADVCIMLFDLANSHGVDLAQEIQIKMAINRNRIWVETPGGTFRHVKMEDE